MNTMTTLRTSLGALGFLLCAATAQAQTAAPAGPSSPALATALSGQGGADTRPLAHARVDVAPSSLALKPQKKPNPWWFYSDARLKQDIVWLSRLPNGLNLYSYRYVWSDTVYVGVMAQQVAALLPEAVTTAANGYLAVDYARLGLEFMTLEQWTAKQPAQQVEPAAGQRVSSE